LGRKTPVFQGCGAFQWIGEYRAVWLWMSGYRYLIYPSCTSVGSIHGLGRVGTRSKNWSLIWLFKSTLSM